MNNIHRNIKTETGTKQNENNNITKKISTNTTLSSFISLRIFLDSFKLCPQRFLYPSYILDFIMIHFFSFLFLFPFSFNTFVCRLQFLGVISISRFPCDIIANNWYYC